MKISIIGIGKVGATTAYTLMVKGLGSQLVLYDVRHEIARAEAADLSHANAFTGHFMSVVAAKDVQDTAGSDVLIVTASVPTSTQIKSRGDWGRANLQLYAQVIPQLANLSPQAVLVVVTNPVDVMTYHALKLSGFDSRRVVGTGTLIDSARFRALLSAEFNIHPDDIRAYILGEHGESQFPATSLALAGGERLDHIPRVEEVFRQSVKAGWDIFLTKGYTNYAIAQAVSLIVETIAQDDRRTMPLSCLVDGFLDVRDVCLSMPVVLGRQGIVRQLHPALSDAEAGRFRLCAQNVRQAIDHSLKE